MNVMRAVTQYVKRFLRSNDWMLLAWPNPWFFDIPVDALRQLFDSRVLDAPAERERELSDNPAEWRAEV